MYTSPQGAPPLYNPFLKTIFSPQSTENISFKRNRSEKTCANWTPFRFVSAKIKRNRRTLLAMLLLFTPAANIPAVASIPGAVVPQRKRNPFIWSNQVLATQAASSASRVQRKLIRNSDTFDLDR